MKKIIFGLLSAVVIAVASLGAKASATSNKCTITGTALGAWGSTFTVRDSKITSTFTVNGQNCTLPAVSLVTWKTPSASGQPLYQQKIYDFKTKAFEPGQHSLTVKLPDCYYQADLMIGTKHDWAEADNTPKRIQFPKNQGDPWPDMGLRDFKLGGDKKCAEKPTPVPPKPTSKPQVQGAVTTLPNTGISFGSILGLGFSIAMLGTLVHQQVQKRFSRS